MPRICSPMRLSAGRVFAVAAVVLVLAGATGLQVLAASSRIGYDYGGLEIVGSRAVYAKAVVMEEGDRLIVRPELFAGPHGLGSDFDFYIVEGGGRAAFVEGREPARVFARYENVSATGCCTLGHVTYDRRDGPQDPPATGVQDPRYVDLVWLFALPNASSLDEELLERSLDAATSGPAYRALPVVVGRVAVFTLPVTLFVMAIAAATGGIAAIAWARTVLRAPLPIANGAEAWLRLYDAAGTYLRSVRDLLVAGLLVAFVVAVHIATVSYPALFAAARDEVTGTMMFAFNLATWSLYGAVLAGIVVTLVRVQRALIAWRKRSSLAALEI